MQTLFEEASTLSLVDKDFSVILSMLKELKEITPKELRERDGVVAQR